MQPKMLFDPFKRFRSRTAPTGYEKVRLLFHLIRTFQLVSSVIVGSIVCYFLWWLVHDHYHVPWTFAILTFTSFLTVLCLTVTLTFHCLTGLSPKFNLALNSVMLGCWAVGYAMLFRWSFVTISGTCSTSMWHNEDGAMICRTYKALFSFALTGFVSTAAAVALDVHIYRLTVRFGKHMRLDNMISKPRVVDARVHHGDVEAMGRNSEAFEVPREGYGAGPNAHQSKQLLDGEGYAQKDSHFDYDTGYRGGHAERVFGA